MITNRKNERQERRNKSIRRSINGTPERYRLTVFRSASHIYAQIIDDVNGKTLAAASTRDKDIASQLASVQGKVEKSKVIGSALAQRALAKNISKVAFDRNGYLYHGRIKAVAEAARESGLIF